MMDDHEDPKEQLMKSDCQRYAKIIKETLTIDTHNEFVRIMRNFHKSRIDFAGIKEKVMELFEGHPELLKIFNNYLPNEFKINLSQEDREIRESKKPFQYEVAMNFVNNMKMGLQDSYHIYISFLEVLNSYRMGKISAFQVHQEVADLLSDHQDLLMGFTNLFPDYHNAHNQHTRSEKETIGSHAEHSQQQHVGQPEPDKESSEQHRSTHESYVHSLEDTVFNLFPTDMHDRVVRLCKTVKEQLRNPDNYAQFLKCIKHYQTENINLKQLQSMVHDLLQDHPNLVKEFGEVINHGDKGRGKRSATSSRITLDQGKMKRSRVSKEVNNKVKSLHGREGTRGQDETNSFHEFLMNEIDFSPIVDLEKGGFASFMHDSKQNHDREDVSER